MALRVDGQPRAINELMTYKGVLLQDVPNMAWLFGYINASWTLKVDMAAAYVCRLLNHMEHKGVDVVTARAPDGQMQDDTIVGALRSGYMQRGQAMLPRQGRSLPWRVLARRPSRTARCCSRTRWRTRRWSSARAAPGRRAELSPAMAPDGERTMKTIESSFASQGERCAGTLLHARQRGERPPVIVMAHGFAGVRAMLMPHAQRFVEAGYAVFLFDYRNFGDSEGQPRHWVDPVRHLQDWDAAIRHVKTLEGDRRASAWCCGALRCPAAT